MKDAVFLKFKKILEVQGLQILQDDLRRRGFLVDIFPDDRANADLFDRILNHTDIIVIKEVCEHIDTESSRIDGISKKWKKELWLNDEAIKVSWDFFKQLFSAKLVSKIDVKKDECCDGILVKKVEELENRISDMQDSITKISAKLTKVNNQFKDMDKMYNEKNEDVERVRENTVDILDRIAQCESHISKLQLLIKERNSQQKKQYTEEIGRAKLISGISKFIDHVILENYFSGSTVCYLRPKIQDKILQNIRDNYGKGYDLHPANVWLVCDDTIMATSGTIGFFINRDEIVTSRGLAIKFVEMNRIFLSDSKIIVEKRGGEMVEIYYLDCASSADRKDLRKIFGSITNYLKYFNY